MKVFTYCSLQRHCVTCYSTGRQAASDGRRDFSRRPVEDHSAVQPQIRPVGQLWPAGRACQELVGHLHLFWRAIKLVLGATQGRNSILGQVKNPPIRMMCKQA